MKPLQGNLDFFLIRASRGPFPLKHKTEGPSHIHIPKGKLLLRCLWKEGLPLHSKTGNQLSSPDNMGSPYRVQVRRCSPQNPRPAVAPVGICLSQTPTRYLRPCPQAPAPSGLGCCPLLQDPSQSDSPHPLGHSGQGPNPSHQASQVLGEAKGQGRSRGGGLQTVGQPRAP